MMSISMGTCPLFVQLYCLLYVFWAFVSDFDFDTIQLGCLLELSFQHYFPDGTCFHYSFRKINQFISRWREQMVLFLTAIGLSPFSPSLTWCPPQIDNDYLAFHLGAFLMKDMFALKPSRFPLFLITQQVGELGHFLLGATSRDMARWFSNI